MVQFTIPTLLFNPFEEQDFFKRRITPPPPPYTVHVFVHILFHLYSRSFLYDHLTNTLPSLMNVDSLNPLRNSFNECKKFRQSYLFEPHLYIHHPLHPLVKNSNIIYGNGHDLGFESNGLKSRCCWDT